MKVIFLDIDGVLNGHEKLENSYCQINQSCMRRINKILESTNAFVVISSSWRYMMLTENPAMTLVGFQYLFYTHGMFANKIIGYTCSDEQIASRKDQILHWLCHNNVSSWIVIDDLNLDFSENNFLQTDGKIGLTDDDVKKAVYILNKIF